MLSEQAKATKNAYMQVWRDKNKQHLREYYKKYRKDNPDKYKQYRVEYWERKAAKGVIEC